MKLISILDNAISYYVYSLLPNILEIMNPLLLANPWFLLVLSFYFCIKKYSKLVKLNRESN